MDSKCNGKALDNFLPFHYHPTPEELKKLAWKELGETETLKQECLAELRKLVRDHDVACISSDEFLLRFLRCQKFHVQKAFGTLRNYARFRVSIHQRLLDLKPEIVKILLDLNVLGFLPYRDAKGFPYAFNKAGIWNPNICSLEEIQTVTILCAHYETESELTQVVGIATVYDTTNVPFSNVIRMIPYFNFWRNFLLECLPARYQDLHLIITNTLGKLLLPLIHPLTPKVLRDKFRYYEAAEKVSENIDPVILPEEYGGSLGSLKNEEGLSDVMIEYLQKMKDEQRYFLR